MSAPTDPPADRLRAVYCARCDSRKPLALVGPGTLVIKHKGAYIRHEGITGTHRVWAECPRCGEGQAIAVPPSD